jgi:hypothetical protein
MSTNPEFVNIPALIERHAAQVADFEQWASAGNWQAFHDHHYDWWAFPIDKPSSYAFAYTVYSGEITQMWEVSRAATDRMSVVTRSVMAAGFIDGLTQHLTTSCWLQANKE